MGRRVTLAIVTRAEQKIVDEAMELSIKERARVTAALIASLDADVAEDPSVVRAAWRAEIAQRVERVVSGASAGIPWPEARARIEAGRRKR